MKLAIIIPAFNEQKTIGEVLRTLPKNLPQIDSIEAVVIDDGSLDQTPDLALNSGAIILTHVMNRGLGAALGTGLEYAKKNNFDLAVTFDADGQHNPNDIAKVVKPIIDNQAEVVIGSRLANPKGMPWYRILGNWGLNIFTFLIFWIWTTDSQSGLRAFGKKAIEKIKINTDRMEVSSEIINEIGRLGLKLKEVPIEAIYSEYSLSKGQKNINAFKILFKMMVRRLLG